MSSTVPSTAAREMGEKDGARTVVSHTPTNLTVPSKSTSTIASQPISWISLALTLDGRDQMTKLLQYLARFLAYWWKSADHNETRRWNALKESLSHSRKAFRLGRPVFELPKLQQHLRLAALALLHTYRQRTGDIATTMRSDNPSQSPKEQTLSILNTPIWKQLSTTIKLAGLMVYWAADNLSFLVASGCWDHPDDRMRQQQRQQLQARFSRWANRSYFMSALVGLFINFRAYREHQQKLQSLKAKCTGGHPSETNVQCGKSEEDASKAEEVHLLLALIKSCCDVLVFSNVAGVDVWKRVRGQKMHEGVHCVSGLISASSVLYQKLS